MEISEPGDSRVVTRLGGDDLLWVLANADGTYLAAWHGQAGRVLLSWTTEAEMETSVARLFEQAPDLFARHQPEQLPFRELIQVAHRCGCRLRIDEYVIEEARPSDAGDP